jgi:uncharacterized protein YfkK (UPF0435 family)
VDEKTAAEVKELLQIIELKEMVHSREMAAIRRELLLKAAKFESYTEMYLFIKANTFSLGHFCKDMLDAAPIFWAAKGE